MDTVWREAIERFSVEVAPPALHLTHSLLNSFGPSTFSDMEMLDDPTSAQAWMDAVLDEWGERHRGIEVPRIPLGSDLVRSVKHLRANVRDLLGGLAVPDEALSAPAWVSVREGRFELVPQGAGADWLRSAVSLELAHAYEHGRLRRLKVCRNPVCLVAFYDRSNNNARVWHNMAQCGTPQHVREWRKRQRAASDN